MKNCFRFTILFVLLAASAQAQWEKVTTLQHFIPTYGTDYQQLAAIGPTVFATPDVGVLKTTDNGVTWIPCDSGLSPIPAFIPTFDELIVQNGKLYSSSGSTMFISADTGKSWHVLTGAPFSIQAFWISNGNIIVGSGGGFGDDTIFVSVDTGKTWQSAAPGLSAYCFAESNQVIFAGINARPGGVLLSLDHGLTWNPADSGPQNVRTMAASNGNLFAAGSNGVFLTSDNGSTWVPADNGLPGSTIYSLTASGDTLFANPGLEQVYCSTNNGTSWSKCIGNGLSPGYRGPFLINDGEVFMCANGQGVFVSSDNGADWSSHNPLSIATAPVNRLQTIGQNLFACSQGGLFVSSDSGTTWSADSVGMGANMSVSAITSLNGTYFAGTSSGMFLSTNSGATWTHSTDTSLKSAGILDFAMSGKLFFALYNGGTFVSSDNGLTWKKPHEYEQVNGSQLLAVSTNLYVATSSGIYFSPDTGVDWYENQGMPITQPISSFATMGKLLFAGTSGDGVWLSTDSGYLWNEIDSGLSDLYISTLHVMNDTLFAAGNGSGISFSVDTGKSWALLDTVFPYTEAPSSLAISDGYLFVATTDSGIWRYRLVKPSTQKNSVLPLPQSLGMLSSYPNPLTHSSIIQFSTAESGYASISIINQLGEEVSRLYSGTITAGEHRFEWNVPTGLPAGMYECIVKMDGTIQGVSLSVQ